MTEDNNKKEWTMAEGLVALVGILVVAFILLNVFDVL